MKPLVFLEHDGAELESGAVGVLGKAATFTDGDVAAVLAGRGPLDGLAARAAAHGAARMFVAEDDALDLPVAQPRIDLIERVMADGGYDTVLFSTSVLAADVAAGLAGRLGAGLNWDLVDLELRDGEPVGRRLALQDSVMVDVGWRSTPRLALFRRGVFDAATPVAREPVTEAVTVPATEPSRRVTVVEHTPSAADGPSIGDAEVIVAGGIGLGGAEHFALAEELAAVLGGAVGATRAAVYKGWYPAAAQIGQTGRTVSPRLYVALGISGAVQHKVGMQNSKVIVAVNTDAQAPIFGFSDLGVVGDVHTIVPKLVDLLQERKGRD